MTALSYEMAWTASLSLALLYKATYSAPMIERGSDKGLGQMVLSGSAWLIGARFGRTFITLFGMMALARLLTPADFGVLAFSTSASLLSLVIVEGLIDYPAIREDGLSLDILRSLIWLSIGVTTCFSAMLWVAAPALEAALAFPHLSLGLRAMVPVSLAQVPFVAASAVLRRQHQFGVAARLSLLTVALYVAIAIALAVAGFGLWSVLIGQVVAQIVTAFLIVRAAKLPIAPPRRFIFEETLHIGSWGAVTRLLGWAWTNVDTVAVSIALGPVATGLYSRAYNINVQAKEPFAAIDQTLRQAFAALKHRDGGFAKQNMMALRLVTLLSSFAGAAMIILRLPIVLLLLGDQWSGAAPALGLLAISLPARIARLYFDSLAISTGNMRVLATRHAIILALIVGGLFVAAPHGIAWVAATVSIVLYITLPLVSSGGKEADGSDWRSVIKAMAPGLAFSTILVLIAEFCIPPQFEHNFWIGLSLRFTILGLGLIALLWFTPNAWLGEKIASMRNRLRT